MIGHLEGLISFFKNEPIAGEDFAEGYSDQHLMSLADGSEDVNIREWAAKELERRKPQSLKKRREE